MRWQGAWPIVSYQEGGPATNVGGAYCFLAETCLLGGDYPLPVGPPVNTEGENARGSGNVEDNLPCYLFTGTERPGIISASGMQP